MSFKSRLRQLERSEGIGDREVLVAHSERELQEKIAVCKKNHPNRPEPRGIHIQIGIIHRDGTVEYLDKNPFPSIKPWRPKLKENRDKKADDVY